MRVLVMLLLGLTFAAGIHALWFGAPALADVVFARRAGSVGSLVRGGELVFGLGASIFGVMFVGIACAGAYAMTRRVNPAQEDRLSPLDPDGA